MLRTALRPRWVVLLLVVLVAATGMARLGQWQLDRARERGEAERAAAAAAPAVPLASLLTPQTSFPSAALDRRVEVTGRWEPEGQVLVAGRLQAGRSGLWVLTPLRVGQARLGVVRGWVAAADDPAASASLLPGGDVRVDGVLRPGEPGSGAAGAGASLPSGQVDRIDFAALAQRWEPPLYTGYLVSISQAPAPAAAATPGLLAVPAVHEGGGGLNLQNLSYAVQWWLFALFGLFLWFRIVRDDHQGVLRGAPAGPDRAPGTAIGDDGDVEQPSQPALPGAAP